MSAQTYCWIHPHEEYDWYPGTIDRKEGGIYYVRDDNDQNFEVKEKEAIFVEAESLRK